MEFGKRAKRVRCYFEMNFTFLITCEWQDQDTLLCGVKQNWFSIRWPHTFYLANITWIFDIPEPLITFSDACLGQARINDRRGMMVTCIIRLLPTPLATQAIWPKLLPPFLLLVSTRSPCCPRVCVWSGPGLECLCWSNDGWLSLSTSIRDQSHGLPEVKSGDGDTDWSYKYPGVT